MPGLAGGPDPATVALDEMLDNGKAKTGAALLARAGLVHAVEALEDPFEGLGWYPRTVVLDRNLNLPAIQARVRPR